MHTKDKLAEALREAGLTEMADKAATGYYHDFLSPLDVPAIQLANDLQKANTEAAKKLLNQHLNGEFDANEEESEAWANSPEGREVFERLMKRK